ncbi:CBS domain-containing protein [Saccharothrix syringae]|uniref:CBS domain-containing protein n=1 Tax=Saccharothrix syringae TaxID=103733 RepID=A0A5Q0H194_SACSY|nr:CBS domain-containing protein [Saccharothrix syringae]QFZ19675.1 CBS domain-containing protein [Saccharothrix syringae]
MREPTVASLMTREVVSAGPTTPFKDIAATLIGREFAAVPVVDDDGHPIGVVSEDDLLPEEEYRGGIEAAPSSFAGHEAKRRWHRAHGTTAADVMTAPVVTVGPDEPVSAAAHRLAEAGVRGLFVVDAGGRLVGVLSRRDLLRVLLRPDDELRDEITREVLGRALWLEPAAVEVGVTDGVVTLRGHVERRSEADIAVRLTRAVPGVVDVVDQLTHSWDDTDTSYRFG